MRRKLVLAPFLLAFVSIACEWDPSHPLERYAPPVDDAIRVLDAGDAMAAVGLLTPYLESNACDKGQIAISQALRDKQRAGLDLGIVLFHVAESYGQRFVDDEHEQPPAGLGADHVTCALAVVRELGDSGSAEDRARAAFVEGNLLFFNGAYKEAVLAYDRALLWWPPAEGDDASMAADVAFNRAIALKRSKEEPDAGNDASSDDAGDNDAASDASSEGDGASDEPNDAGSQDSPDAAEPPDSGSPPPQEPDAGDAEDAGAEPPPPPPEEPSDAGLGEPPPEALERLLDDLERAPTVQQEIIRRERRKRIRPEEDK